MTGFFIGAAVLVAIVLVLLARPYYRLRASDALSRGQMNAQVLREQLQRLDQDLALGTLRQEDYEQAKAELKRRTLEEQVQEEAAATVVRPPKKTIIAVALLVPLVAAALYALIGHPQGAVDQVAAAHQANQDIERMVQGLADKLEKEPGNLKGWSMLARSYKVMGRTQDAQRAFERAGSFVDTDAQLLAEYADVMAANSGGNLSGKPKELVDKALKVDPNNPMALWLSGTAAASEKRYDAAIATWEKLLPQLDANSQDAQLLQQSIDEVRTIAGKPATTVVAKGSAAAALAAATAGGPPPAAAATTQVAAGNVNAKTTASVTGTVDIAPALKAKAAPSDTLMIIARVPGTRMPLAVIRVPASQLPMNFTLDDSVAMNPQAGISSVPEVEVEARISKTGMAMPAAGDLLSSAQTVKVGSKGLKLQVTTVRP